MATELEDLRILKTAEGIADAVWKRVVQWEQFAKDVVGKQMTRAVDSVGANIAESYGRFNYGEKLQFLYYSRGSLFETKYWLNRALVRELMKAEEVKEYATRLSDVARQLNMFANSLKSQRKDAKPQKSVREQEAEYIVDNWLDDLAPLFTDQELDWLITLPPVSNLESLVRLSSNSLNHSTKIKRSSTMTRIFDLSQDLNQDASFWPFYPPFEVKYIKRKSEHGVNAQYIQTSNHMGTHLDAPKHFVTNGKTIDQIPIEWCYGPGVVVDLSDMLDDVGIFTPEDIEKRVEVKDGDILFIHTGWHKYSFFSPTGDEERYIQRHPGPHFSICDWLLKKKIHIWGVDMISTDHPMNLPIGRFLGKGGLEHWQKVRALTEKKFGADQMDVLFPDSAYQLTHNALFPHDCMHVENLGGDIGLKELHNKRITLGVFPWKFKGGEAAFCRAVAWA